MKREFKLRDINRVTNGYCGPSAVSSLTGLGTDVVERHFKNLLGDVKIKGVHTRDLLKVLEVFGIKARYKTLGERKSLRRFIDHPARDKDTIYLVVAGDHFQLIQGKRFVCSLTQKIVSVNNNKVRTRTKVRSVYALSATEVVIPKVTDTFKEQVRQRQIKANYIKRETNEFGRVKRKVIKLAEEAGLQVVKITRTSYKIFVPEDKREQYATYLGCFYPNHIQEYYDSRDWDYELDYLIGGPLGK